MSVVLDERDRRSWNRVNLRVVYVAAGRHHETNPVVAVTRTSERNEVIETSSKTHNPKAQQLLVRLHSVGFESGGASISSCSAPLAVTFDPHYINVGVSALS